MTNSLPSGIVTFLFTDIEGSTLLAQEHPDAWEDLRKRHHTILRSAMDLHNGYVFQIIGDAFCVAFNTASAAIRAAIDSQKHLYTESWDSAPIKVRMGIHTGQAEVQENGDYQGYLAMSRVQRLMSAGHGGQILISRATQELIRDELPANVSLRDMGERRLKDLIRPEHIYQLDITSLPVDFPPLKTLDKYRHNLPTQLTSFIGREKEMAEVKQALAEHRLVTLTGSGGAGKTRLSLQVAADSLDQFPSGIWFVELAPLTDPDLIPQTILTATGIQTQQGKSALDGLIDFLREKTSLLILDNCEHLIEACAKIADTLLNAAPNIKILASSREALGIKGEQSWRVPSLSAPDVKHLPSLEQLSQYEAVRLFIDRALLVQSHFTVTNQNAPAIAQICHQLDGIPLAIELAAARIRMLSAEQIAERLDDRFRLLTGGSRTALPRQQTLRALIDWSYDLLSEKERTLLRRLAVFSGGCTLEAVEQICSYDHNQAEEILDLLTHLVDKSLLAIEEQSGYVRYHILETVRQYARGKLLESGEGEQIRQRHLDYFLKLAEEIEPRIYSPQQIFWMKQLRNELDNLRAALDWSLNNSQINLIRKGLRLASALNGIWEDDYNIEREGRGWLQKGLALLMHIDNGDEGISLIRAKALCIAGRLIVNHGDRDIAREMLEESVKLYRSAPSSNKLDFAMALTQLAYAYLVDDLSLSLAFQSTQESISICQALGAHGQWHLSNSYYWGGCVAYRQENFDLAIAQANEGLKICNQTGIRISGAQMLQLLGWIVSAQGDYLSAKTYFDKALNILQEIDDGSLSLNIILVKSDIADNRVALGEFETAHRLLNEVLSYYHDKGDKWSERSTLSKLAKVLITLNDYNQATSTIQKSLLVHSPDIKNEIGFDVRLVILAEIFRFKGELVRSATLLGAMKSASEKFRRSENRDLYKKCNDATYAALGEEAYNVAYAEGLSMSMEQAIEYALESLQAYT
jgi:predicted ATPase/class 3 adenylate cyclase